MPSAKPSDVDLLGYAQRIVEFDPKVSDRAIHFGVSKQELDGPKIASLPVDQRSLSASKRMRPVPARIQSDGRHPVADETCILPGRKVRRTVEPAWEKELATKHGGRCNPLDNRSSRVLRYFELNWPACLALDDRHAVSNCSGNNEIGHFEANKVATAKLAVDSEVEQHEVALIPGEFEPRTNCPDLPWQEWTFLANQSVLIPRWPRRCDYWKLDTGHSEVSIQPSHTRHRHPANLRILLILPS